ncbi:MAG: sugar kinase [Syntrophaceae bacterium]|nr:sugar kinase [Syntrophaceae bacterium]
MEDITQPIQVFGVGQCSLDYIGKIDAYPPADRKCEFFDMVIQGGGPVATALVALARWGVSCAFSGVVGDDPFGRVILESLEAEGIDTAGVMTRKGKDSQFAFIAAEPGRGRRTIFWRRPTGDPLSPEEIDLRRVEQARVLHTDGRFVEASLAACKAARKAGVQVVADADTFHEGLVELARWSDFFISSENFAAALIRKEDPHEACRRIVGLGPKVAGVTLGAKGYVALAEGRWIERPAYPVEAVDTTGCGDVFHAGFIFGLLRKWDYEKCFDFAAWAAAMVSRKMGGRSGIPSLEQVRERGFFG